MSEQENPEVKPDVTQRRKPLAKKPIPFSHALIELSALATLAYLAHLHRESLEVTYIAITLIAGIVCVRWKRGDDTSGPVTAFLGAMGLIQNGTNVG